MLRTDDRATTSRLNSTNLVKIDFVLPKLKAPSGAERLVLSLGSALRRRGDRVRVLCHSFDPSCRPLAAGLEVVETGQRLEWTGNHYLDAVSSYVLAPRLRRLIADDTDVVCVFGPALWLAAGRRRQGRPLLYFCFEPPRAMSVDRGDVLARVGAWRWPLALGLWVYSAVDRWLVRRVDGVLVNGEYGAELVRSNYGRLGHVITHGGDLPPPRETRAEARRWLGLENGAPVVLTVNFLHPRKRVDLLLRAWVEVGRRLPTARLLIVGDGPEREPLQRLARQLGVAQTVCFAGFVPENRIAACYLASDLLAHTGREETFGLTILEAGASGLPAVAVDEGGPRTTIRDGESGVLVPAEAPAIADAITLLLAQPGRRRAMGECARAWIQARYSWEQGAEDFAAACRALAPADR